MSSPSSLTKKGIAASPGISIGQVYLVDRRHLKTPKRHLDLAEVDAELERFERAIDKSHVELESIKVKLEADNDQHSDIIEAHQMMLRDDHLVGAARRHITNENINAEWALQKSVEAIKKVFDAIEDDYFRERRSDIEFVGDRILRSLLGRELNLQPPPTAIVVAHDLGPADTVGFYRAEVAGLVTDVGGKTSHTAIVARSHEIPAVVGLEDITHNVANGDVMIVDGTSGVAIVHPSSETLSHYRKLAKDYAARDALLLANKSLPSRTLDGQKIILLANLDQVDEVKGAIAHGAEGVGLFRSEYPFMASAEYPSEDDHFRHAKELLEGMDGRPLTIRTLDLGSDKTSKHLTKRPKEANPALGLRSLRLCLSEGMLGMFRNQIRGLLRASVYGDLRLMLPMVSGIGELENGLSFIENVKQELRGEGIHFDANIEIGAMIEMPSAALVADHLAKRVSFFSIGTNDLIQYTLAVDRVNENVSYLYQPMHPAMIRLFERIVDAAETEGIPVSVCGEIAGNPEMIPLLIGLGLRTFSMFALAIPGVKDIVRRIDTASAKALAKEVLTLSRTDEIKKRVQRFIEELPASTV